MLSILPSVIRIMLAVGGAMLLVDAASAMPTGLLLLLLPVMAGLAGTDVLCVIAMFRGPWTRFHLLSDIMASATLACALVVGMTIHAWRGTMVLADALLAIVAAWIVHHILQSLRHIRRGTLPDVRSGIEDSRRMIRDAKTIFDREQP